jgi:hypothetical protein
MPRGPAYHARTHLPGGTDPLIIASGGGDSWAGAVTATPDLTAWWRLGDTFTFASSVADAFADSALLGGIGRHLDYAEPGSTARPTLQVANTALADDDGAVQWSGNSTPGHSIAPDNGLGIGSEWGVTRFDGGNLGTNSLRSMIVWVKRGSLPDAVPFPIMGRYGPNVGSSADAGWALEVNNATGAVRFVAVGGVTVTGPVLTVGTWYFVAATWDGATYKLYVNGALAASAASATPPTDTGTAVAFAVGYGQYKTGVTFESRVLFGGATDEAALFSRALTAAEVLALYTAGITGGDADAGKVLTADGAGGTSWEFPTIETRLNGA